MYYYIDQEADDFSFNNSGESKSCYYISIYPKTIYLNETKLFSIEISAEYITAVWS